MDLDCALLEALCLVAVNMYPNLDWEALVSENLWVGVAWAVLYLVVESSSSADGLLSSLAEAAMGELLQRMAAAAEEDDPAISGVEGGVRGCRGFGNSS